VITLTFIRLNEEVSPGNMRGTHKGPPMDYLLIYDYVADYLDRRGAFRSEHLGLAWAAQAKGNLVLAGAFPDAPFGAVLHFRADSPAVIEAFIQADPYVTNGLVTKWQIREWITVVGDAASSPIRPAGA